MQDDAVDMDFGAQISTRALQHLSVPFRLHGRDAVGGFDCVSLVADVLLHAGFDAQAPADYSLRGRFSERVLEFFNHAVFTPVQTLRKGDFLAVRTAHRQSGRRFFARPRLEQALPF